MAKYTKGDKVIARPPATREEGTGNIISTSNNTQECTITKVHPHGLSTKEAGYVSFQNVIGKP